MRIVTRSVAIPVTDCYRRGAREDTIMPFPLTQFPVPGVRSEVDRLADLVPEHLALLDEPIPATVATLRERRPAQLSVVWVSRDDEFIYLNSPRTHHKSRNLRQRPEVTVLVMNPANAFHWLSVEGRVVEVVDEEHVERGHEPGAHADDLSEAYLGRRPYPNRRPGEVRVMYKIAPTRVVAFGPFSL